MISGETHSVLRRMRGTPLIRQALAWVVLVIVLSGCASTQVGAAAPCTAARTAAGTGAVTAAVVGGAAASTGASAGLLSDAGAFKWWDSAGSGTWIGAVAGVGLGLIVGAGVGIYTYFKQKQEQPSCQSVGQEAGPKLVEPPKDALPDYISIPQED